MPKPTDGLDLKFEEIDGRLDTLEASVSDLEVRVTDLEDHTHPEVPPPDPDPSPDPDPEPDPDPPPEPEPGETIIRLGDDYKTKIRNAAGGNIFIEAAVWPKFALDRSHVQNGQRIRGRGRGQTIFDGENVTGFLFDFQNTLDIVLTDFEFLQYTQSLGPIWAWPWGPPHNPVDYGPSRLTTERVYGHHCAVTARKMMNRDISRNDEYAYNGRTGIDAWGDFNLIEDTYLHHNNQVGDVPGATAWFGGTKVIGRGEGKTAPQDGLQGSEGTICRRVITRENTTGIWMDFHRNGTIEDCENSDESRAGIDLEMGGGHTVNRNRNFDCGYGIMFRSAGGALRENEFYRPLRGGIMFVNQGRMEILYGLEFPLSDIEGTTIVLNGDSQVLVNIIKPSGDQTSENSNQPVPLDAIHLDYNLYRVPASNTHPFELNGVRKTFAEWKNETPFDANSELQSS